MAYTKQTWTNDVTAITAERMTHIENGIYDNSLGVDKINPSGTATTTAEIEEGQVNDVIGFKSLKLKGQTSQYTTTGKNLFDGILENGNISAGADITDSNIYRSKNYIPVTSSTAYAFSVNGTLNRVVVSMYDENKTFLTNDGDTGLATTTGKFTTYNNAKYVRFRCYGDDKSLFSTGKIQLETGTSATSYEKYSGGKASPSPDFPQDVENVSGYNAIEISNVNKLPYAQSGSHAVSGMTHTSNGKGTYTLNGTATANSRYDWEIEPYTIKQGDYLYLGNTATNSTVTVALLENASTQIMCTGPTQVNRIVSLNNYVGRKVTYLRTYTNAQTLNNFTLKPMICTTTSVSTFEEHQGNNFDIKLSGNLVEDETFVQGSYFDNTTTTRISCRNAKLKANTTYTLSTNLDFSTFNIALATQIIPFPNNLTLIYDSTWKAGTFSFTTGSQSVYTNISVRKSNNANITPDDVEGVWLMLEEGAIATPHKEYFPPIEICKIGTYQDYIFKRDGKWYKHKEVGKVVWNGTENWQNNAGISTTYVIARPTDLAQANNNVFYNYFSTVADLSVATEGARIGSSINLKNPNTADLASFKTWLGTNNVEMYYQSNTPTDEEITYAPLLRQLDELYNSGLYDVTNISQDNSSEAFILDLEACKNNINGIVEYIRR